MPSDIHRRIKQLEEKTGGKDFFERMEYIFNTESFKKLTSKDVEGLQKFMPDKYEYLVSEIYKLMSANL